jgi:hypothetical protein
MTTTKRNIEAGHINYKPELIFGPDLVLLQAQS